MKIKVSDVIFTPRSIHKFHDCPPFFVYGAEIRIENGGWRYKFPNKENLSDKEIFAKMSKITKYLKNEGLWDLYFSHKEEVPGLKQIKFK